MNLFGCVTPVPNLSVALSTLWWCRLARRRLYSRLGRRVLEHLAACLSFQTIDEVKAAALLLQGSRVQWSRCQWVSEWVPLLKWINNRNITLYCIHLCYYVAFGKIFAHLDYFVTFWSLKMNKMYILFSPDTGSVENRVIGQISDYVIGSGHP